MVKLSVFRIDRCPAKLQILSGSSMVEHEHTKGW